MQQGQLYLPVVIRKSKLTLLLSRKIVSFSTCDCLATLIFAYFSRNRHVISILGFCAVTPHTPNAKSAAISSLNFSGLGMDGFAAFRPLFSLLLLYLGVVDRLFKNLLSLSHSDSIPYTLEECRDLTALQTYPGFGT